MKILNRTNNFKYKWQGSLYFNLYLRHKANYYANHFKYGYGNVYNRHDLFDWIGVRIYGILVILNNKIF